MTPLAAYLLLFVAVGVGFIFVHLVAGKLIRPSKPDLEKGTIYECGEPTIGSAWVQFDLRFYVVALLFVIFDVEVAFFFPWAEVFGKANAVANLEKPTTAAEYRAYAATVLDLAPPARSSLQQKREVERYEQMASASFDDEALAALLKRQQDLRAEFAKQGNNAKLSREESNLIQYDGPLKPAEFSNNQEAARALSWMALGEVLVFFGVLLVGFAYLWRRGDLQWVRSTAAERPEPLEIVGDQLVVAPPEGKIETVGAGGHT
jgi:NADH-quinone oxidoreductase subunit A